MSTSLFVNPLFSSTTSTQSKKIPRKTDWIFNLLQIGFLFFWNNFQKDLWSRNDFKIGWISLIRLDSDWIFLLSLDNIFGLSWSSWIPSVSLDSFCQIGFWLDFDWIFSVGEWSLKKKKSLDFFSRLDFFFCLDSNFSSSSSKKKKKSLDSSFSWLDFSSQVWILKHFCGLWFSNLVGFETSLRVEVWIPLFWIGFFFSRLDFLFCLD